MIIEELLSLIMLYFLKSKIYYNFLMESGEIINNSYKNFGDNISNENKANNPKRILKKIIIISSIIQYNNYLMSKITKLK